MAGRYTPSPGGWPRLRYADDFVDHERGGRADARRHEGDPGRQSERFDLPSRRVSAVATRAQAQQQQRQHDSSSTTTAVSRALGGRIESSIISSSLPACASGAPRLNSLKSDMAKPTVIEVDASWALKIGMSPSAPNRAMLVSTSFFFGISAIGSSQLGSLSSFFTTRSNGDVARTGLSDPCAA